MKTLALFAVLAVTGCATLHRELPREDDFPGGGFGNFATMANKSILNASIDLSGGGGSVRYSGTVSATKFQLERPAGSAYSALDATIDGNWTYFTGTGLRIQTNTSGTAIYMDSGDVVLNSGQIQLASAGRVIWGGGNYISNNGATGITYATGGWGLGVSALFGSVAPTIGAAGTSPSVLTANGTAGFRVDVGTGGTATGFTMTFSTVATNRWTCQCQNVTTPTTVARIIQTGGSTTTCVMEQRTAATNVALTFAAGDDVDCTAVGQ